MVIKLLSLKLRNFKGVRQFELQANGENVTVYGQNEAGKTTLFDAMTWLLFDKDSQNRKDFDIKTLDANGNPLHGLEHESEATFDIDGKPLNLRKVYKEKWTRKRGSATDEFTGHTTDYFVNGVPVQKGEYSTKIDQLIKEDVFRLLTSPAHFNSLHWTERRKILLEVCGDITDQAVIDSNEALKSLPDILNGNDIDAHKRIIAAKRAEINKELDRMPVRIDEVQRSIPEAPEKSAKELQSSIDNYNQALTAKQQELANIENGGAVSAKRIELQQIESEILSLDRKLQEEANGAVQQKYNEMDAIRREISTISGEMDTLKRKWNQGTADVASLEQTRNNLLTEWKAIQVREFELSQDESCPTCGQAIPEERLAEAREKALAEFNQKKASDLEANKEKGMKAKADIEAIKSQLPDIEGKLAELALKKSEKEAALGALQTEADQLRNSATAVRPAEPYNSLVERKKAVSEELQQLQTGTAADAEKVKTEIDAILEATKEVRSELAKFEQIDKANERIEELKAQEKTLAQEFEKLERELYLTEEFTRAKVNLLEEKINGKFKMARFKLFDQQINGGLQETCETIYNGVPYSSNLNTGHKVNVGIDILNTLSEHYGFEAPVFVDNAEGVTQLLPPKSQCIRLVAVPGEKSLRVEYDTQIMKEAI